MARFAVPFVIFLAIVGGLALSVAATPKMLSAIIVGVPVFCIAVVGLGWTFWRTVVHVDEKGMSWREGKETRAFRWNELEGIRGVANRSRLDVAVVQKDNMEQYVVPVMNRELYELLKSRFGALPSKEEGELYMRWGGR